MCLAQEISIAFSAMSIIFAFCAKIIILVILRLLLGAAKLEKLGVRQMELGVWPVLPT